MAATKEYCLGSGKLYVYEYDGSTIPDDTVLEVDDNILGYIQGGASVSYTPEFYTVEDDLGYVKDTCLTKETVTLTSGILTWNGATLSRLCSTARVTEDASSNKRTVKIGGLSNFSNAKYVIRFVHATNGKKVTIIGSNNGALELTFNPSTETVINAEFTASPMDDEGTLITFEEPTA